MPFCFKCGGELKDATDPFPNEISVRKKNWRICTASNCDLYWLEVAKKSSGETISIRPISEKRYEKMLFTGKRTCR